MSLEVRSGEFLTLLGPSGSGKTTLLMVLAGFNRPDQGSILFGDTEVIRTPTRKRDVGMVFQNYALFPHLREQMRIELRHLHEQLDMTTVYVTHDQREALTMSDRVAVINHGKLMQLDAPRRIYDHPANAFVANFIGESTLLRVGNDTIQSTHPIFAGVSALYHNGGQDAFDLDAANPRNQVLEFNGAGTGLYAIYGDPVPLPAGVWLFVSALVGTGWWRARTTKTRDRNEGRA